MGFFKKIFKPVSKVLDKIIPNEIKPALPYLAAFAPMFGPTSALMGKGIMQRALLSGGLNIAGQLAQEGNEGDINLLSAGLGALSGAMTAPGTPGQAIGVDSPAANNALVRAKGTGGFRDVMASGIEKYGAESAGGQIFTGLDKASKFMTDPGLMKYGIPAAQGTGDLMFAQAKRDQDEYDRMMEEEAENEYASDAARAFAIRQSMESYGFTEEEILDAIAAAGYKAGGRVGFRFGGIDEAIESVQEETIEKGKEGIMMAAKEDPMLVEEYNKYVFDLMEQRPDAKPMTFQDFKRMIKSGMKTGGRVKAEEGGLMDLGGKEMDLRSGGFVPIGEEEKADDVPARLSKNEFVMTADAVRAAGGGSVNEGAKRMYDVMNKLEAKA
jgi:uncharacterized short protein YbdD (DUF466 family)